MFWATAVLLVLTATPPSAARLASTYDQAACGDSDGDTVSGAELHGAEAIACAPAPTPPPAVIDCNDERPGGFTAAMIGSCDMPRPAGALVLARTDSGPSPWVCDGVHCTNDSSPLRPASRAGEDVRPLAVRTLTLRLYLSAVDFESGAEPRLHSALGRRLERPPRTTA